ncbi:MAG: hypothetical protein GY719_26125 [bacterium]|nr:hypothetical protein [bacterium]
MTWPPAPGYWRPEDIPPPMDPPEVYHGGRLDDGWPILTSSLVRRFADPPPDGGAGTWLDKQAETPPMRWGSLVHRIAEAGTSPARCGVIAIDARRGSTTWEIVPEIVRRLADALPEGWTFPPASSHVEVAIGPNKGRGTKGHRDMLEAMEDPEDHRHGWLPVIPGEWASAVDFAGKMLDADPGVWAEARSPMVVTLAEWRAATAVAGSILEPRTPKAKLARRWLIEAPWQEYYVGWPEPVEIAEADLVCPAEWCGGPILPPLAPEEVAPEARGQWTCRGRCGQDFEKLSGEPGAAHVELPCRARPDAVTVHGGNPYVPDLKTTRDPAPEDCGGGFDKQARQGRYHWQLDFYARGLRAHWGLPDLEIPGGWVAVGNEPPHLVDVRDCSEELRAEAREKVDAALYQLALRRAGLVPAEMPGWALDDKIRSVEPYRGRFAAGL